MKAVSEAQYQAATHGGMPEPEPIDDGLWSLPMPMPGDFLAYTLSVVHVNHAGGVTVIDPGWGSDAALDRLDGFLVGIGRSLADVHTVIVTHSHPDHIGLADALRATSGATFVLGRREQESLEASTMPDPGEFAGRLRTWGVADETAQTLMAQISRAGGRTPAAPPAADLLVDDGEALPVADAQWRALITPGHTPGHLCIVDAERSILFSGDHVLPTVFPGIGLGSRLGGNPLDEYLLSLQRLHPYDEFQVVPGHGYRFHGLHARRSAAAAHALRRAREVAEVIAVDPHATTWDVASRLTWTGGWDQLSNSMMLFSGLMQTEMYREFVEDGGLALPHAAEH